MELLCIHKLRYDIKHIKRQSTVSEYQKALQEKNSKPISGDYCNVYCNYYYLL